MANDDLGSNRSAARGSRSIGNHFGFDSSWRESANESGSQVGKQSVPEHIRQLHEHLSAVVEEAWRTTEVAHQGVIAEGAVQVLHITVISDVQSRAWMKHVREENVEIQVLALW